VTRRPALKVILVLVLIAIVAGAAALAWLEFALRRVPSGQPPLATLDSASLPAFRAAFNAGEGEVRVLALLSPT
jgi:hypothetical protein